MTRLSPLETKVLDALADELRFELPDLPGQIAESLVGVRRNTGSGFFTEVIVDRSRPPTGSALTGRFGTIHGDVPGLIEPMAFQVEIAGGRLMALHGMTYDEATSHIDFLVAPVSGLFRIDDQGQSIPWKPRILTEDSPLQALQTWDDPARPPQPSPTAQAALELIFGKPGDATPDAPAASSEDQASLVIGAVVLILVIGLFAVVFFDIPLFFVLIMGGYLIGALMRPKGRAALRKAVDLYKAVRAANGR